MRRNVLPTTIPPFFHLHSHMHCLICVVPLLIIDSHPELSISPSPAPCSFPIYVSCGLRITLNVFCSVISRFPKYPSPWPHPVDEAGQREVEKLADAVPHPILPHHRRTMTSVRPLNLLLLGRRQCMLTQRQISPGFRLNGRVCQAGGLSSSFTAPTSSMSLRVHPLDCRIDGLLRGNFHPRSSHTI
jgi:hypothetical protein